jgi:hypothetical protein
MRDGRYEFSVVKGALVARLDVLNYVVFKGRESVRPELEAAEARALAAESALAREKAAHEEAEVGAAAMAEVLGWLRGEIGVFIQNVGYLDAVNRVLDSNPGRTLLARLAAMEGALRDARTALVAVDEAEDARLEAVSNCIDDGLIERHCADDCPQDDTCDCPDTALVGKAINGVLRHGIVDRRIGSIADLVRTIDAALATPTTAGGEGG